MLSDTIVIISLVVLGILGIGGIWVAVWQGNKVGEALQGIRADIRTLATGRAHGHSGPVPGQDPGHSVPSASHAPGHSGPFAGEALGGIALAAQASSQQPPSADATSPQPH